MSDLSTARNYNELLTSGEPSPHYDYVTLFSGDGFFARRRAKQRFKLLKNLDDRLRRILQPDERVYYITTGTTVSLVEQFFVGWAARYLNNRAIAFTTDRLLLVHINSRKRPRGLVSQIRYEEIAAIKSTWNGVCQVRLRDGKKLKFLKVLRAERKFLHGFLKDIVNPVPLQPGERVEAPEHLCPSCFAVVPGRPADCPSCAAAFKSARTAMVLSLIFPGIGDFYLGHRRFALLEMAGGLFVWFGLVVLPLLTAGEIDPVTGEVIAHDAAFWMVNMVIIGAAHLIDAAMTRHFALKGHYPASSQVKARAEATKEGALV
jgi:hypothetical protein